MKAWINNKKGIGYVVMVTDGIDHKPLRNFGEYYSAAMEFRDWINQCTDERLERWIKGWAETYNPAAKYTYPEWRSNDAKPNLRRQRGKLGGSGDNR